MHVWDGCALLVLKKGSWVMRCGVEISTKPCANGRSSQSAEQPLALDQTLSAPPQPPQTPGLWLLPRQAAPSRKSRWVQAAPPRPARR